MATDTERLLILIEARDAQFAKAMAKITRDADVASGKIVKRLSAAEQRLVSFGAAANTAGKLFRGFAVGLGAGFVLGGLAELPGTIRELISQAAKIQDVAGKIGLTTDRLQELEYQARQTGSSAEQMDAALSEFNKRVGLAAAGSGDLKKVLDENNISLKNADGSQRSLNDVFRDYADLIKNAKNDQDRAVLVSIGLGKANDELAVSLRGGSDEMDRLGKAAHDTGSVMDKDLLARAKEVDDKFKSLEGTISTFAKTEVIRFVEDLSKVMRDLGDWMERIRNISSRGLLTDEELNASKQAEHIDGLNKVIALLEVRLEDLQRTAEKSPFLVLAPQIEETQKQLAAAKAELEGFSTAAGSTGFAKTIGLYRPNTKAQVGTPTKIPNLGATGGRTPAQQFAEDIARERAKTNILIAETAAIKLNRFEQERARAVADLINQAKADGVALSPKVMATINAEADAYARAADAQAKAVRQQQQIIELEKDIADLGVESFAGLIDGTKTLNDLLKDTAGFLEDVVKQQLKLALVGEKGGGTGTGIFGFITNLLSGGGVLPGGSPLGKGGIGHPRAAGGPVVPGMSYPIGERGPEMFTPTVAGVITPNGRSSNQRVVIVLDEGPMFRATIRNEADGVAVKRSQQAVAGYDRGKQRQRLTGPD